MDEIGRLRAMGMETYQVDEVMRGLQTVAAKGFRAFADGGFREEELQQLLADPKAPFAHPRAIPVKDGRSTRLVKTTIPCGGRTIEVAWKRTRPRDWWRDLKERIRTPRPLRSWRIGRQFQEAGIPTARPLLVMVPVHPLRPRDCYVATEWIAGGRKLDDFIRDRADAPRANLARLAHELGRQIGQLHAAGFSHRDLKEENLIVVEREGTLRIHIIDLDGVTRYRRVPRRRRWRDISRLFASMFVLDAFRPTDYRRFLTTYANGQDDWKAMWRWVLRDGRRRLRIKAKRHRTGRTTAAPVLPLERAA